MASIKYYDGVPSDLRFPALEGVVVDGNKEFAKVYAGAGNDTLIIIGHSLVYSGSMLVGGTITEITYTAGSGDLQSQYYRIADIEWDISQGLSTSPVGSALFDKNDRVVGSREANLLIAGSGDDCVRGGRGEDVLFGQKGDDHLRGGRDSDTFVFDFGDGVDIITDFRVSGPDHDRISFSLSGSDHHIEIDQHGNDVVITYGEGDQIKLLDLELDGLSPKDFY